MEGAQLGRYQLEERLGEGGMGVVFAARDPRLERRVAIKILRFGHGYGSLAGRARLLREAQTMAKLAHPNVVPVFDVGESDDDVFVAMELVEGETLGARLERRPGWRAVLELFIGAGRGLAAAHALGIVHRDFKPQNVLVGADGRARVTDFGLARPGNGQDPAAESALADTLTQTGVVMGTPAYMAPEQHRRVDADARSDQFAFAVALYEGLYGERPFAPVADEGLSPIAALAVAVLEGRVRPAPKGAHVPARLRRVVLRGLSVDPERRWPSMDALLHELQGVLRARRTWVAVAAAAALVGGGVALAATGALRRATPCRGAEQRLAGVWDPARRAAVRRAFATSGAPDGEGVFARIAPRLDAWADGWARHRTEVCEASDVRKEQSAEVLDLRMACLDHKLAETNALVGLFTGADRALVARAPTVVRALPALDECDDAAALRQGDPLPSDPARRERSDAAYRHLAQVWALAVAGRPGAEAQAAALVEEARALPSKGLEARGLYVSGNLSWQAGRYDEARKTFVETLYIADEARLDVMRARAANALAHMLVEDGKYAEAAARLREARGALSRTAGSALVRADILFTTGHLALAESRAEDALAAYHEAVELRAAADPESAPLATALLNEANALTKLERPREALAVYERALAITEKTLGPDHNQAGIILSNMAEARLTLEDLPGALTYVDRSLVIQEKALGPDNPSLGYSLELRASLLTRLGRLDEAEADARRSLALREKAYPADSPLTADSLLALSRVLLARGLAAEAVAPARRALAIREERKGNSFSTAAARLTLARALWDAGSDRPEALALARVAEATLATGGPTVRWDLDEARAWRHDHDPSAR